VVLSSSGLAQFTHYGAVTPGASVDLAVRLDQVDDVLKSLTVYDVAAGIGVVSLHGNVPLAELFRDMPFGPEALASRVELLRALIGTEIEISGSVAAKGRLLRIEDEDVALPNGGGRTTKHRLTLMTGRANSAMVQAILEDVAELRFSDPEISAQIDRALSGIDANLIKDSRKLSIGFLGDSSRNAALSYVVAAPVWKTSYRLVLPQDGGKARLQGWAVVENLTGGDWRNVELTLVSGNPVGAAAASVLRLLLGPPRDSGDRRRAPDPASGRRGKSVPARINTHRNPFRCGRKPPMMSPAPQRRRREPRDLARYRLAQSSLPRPSLCRSWGGRQCGGGRGGRDPAALSISRQDQSRHRSDHDGAVRGSRGECKTGLALSAGNRAASSAGGGSAHQ